MTETGTFAAPTLATPTATIPPPPPTSGTPEPAPELPGLGAPPSPTIGAPVLPDPALLTPATAPLSFAATASTSPAVAPPSLSQVRPTIPPPPAPTIAPPPLPSAIAPLPPTATQMPTTSPSLPSIPETRAPVPVPLSDPQHTPRQIDAPSETPKWKRRQNSKVRKVLRRLVGLAVLGGIGAAGYFAYLGFNEQDTATDANGDPTLFDETRDLIDGVNDNQIEADLLAELGLDATGGAASANIQSFTHTYRFGPANAVTTSVDVSTGDSIRRGAEGEIRSIDGRRYEQVAGVWTEHADQRATENTDLLRPAAIVPDAMIPFILTSQAVDATTVSYDVDEYEFSSTSLDGWRAWNTRWTEGAVRTPVAGDRVSITITLNNEGLASSASVVLPTGEVTNYTLDEWAGEPLLVELS